MAHNDLIIDSDGHFIIDPITRVISNQSGKSTLIQFDHNSERITFEANPIFDGHNMVQCNRVEIHYINISTDKRVLNKGLYVVDDLKLTDNKLTFSWLVSRNATQLAGLLSFAIRFICDENGEEVYSFSTSVCNVLNISEGINNSDIVITDDYADIISQWERMLFEASDEGVSNIATAKTEALADIEKASGEAIGHIDETKSSAVNNIIAKGEETKATIPENYALLDEMVKKNSAMVEKHENWAIVQTTDGVDINITDSAISNLKGLTIYGKTNQVQTTGKNLFAFTETNTTLAVGITMTTSAGSSQFTVSGTPTSIFAYEVLTCELPAGTYTMSMYGLAGVEDYVYLKNKNTNAIAVGTLRNGKSKSFTITETTSFAVAPVIRNTTPYAYDNTPVYIQIEQGETATDYEPYSNGVASPSPEYPQPMETIVLSGNITINVDEQTLDVETPNGLPGVPVSSNGNYTDENGQQWVCDEIDFEKGVYIQRVSQFNMPEFDSISTVTNGTGVSLYIGVSPALSNIKSGGLCEVATFNESQSSDDLKAKQFQIVPEPDDTAWIYIADTTDVTEAEFRSKYEGKKMLALIEPIETAISDEVLAVYKALHTNKLSTHIINDAGAHIKVAYVADIKTYIDNKIATAIKNSLVEE